MSPVGAIFMPFPSKTGTNMLHPRPPPIGELVKRFTGIRLVDQTGANARKFGSYLSFFNSADRRGTERPRALAALVSFSIPLA